MTRAVLVAVLAALAVADGAAQTARGDASTRQLKVGEQMTYTVTVEGGRGRGLDAPLASGALRLVSRQPVLDNTVSFNGVTERRVAWAYEGVRAGAGRIAATRVGVGGRVVSLPAVTVTVARGAPAAAPGAASADDELFARAEPGRRTAYVGQQVGVDYVLYFDAGIQPRQTTPAGTWDAAGFWREEMDVPATYPRSVTRGGLAYEAVTIRRIALFPTRPGELTLAPMAFSVDLLRTASAFGNDPFGPFFSPFSSRFDEVEVTAPAATVTVRPLPAGAPPSFAGAVGAFTLTASADRRQLAVGEPVEIRLTIAGTGNVATVDAPEIEAPAGFDAYDPEVDRETFRGATPLRSVKTFLYTLVPQGGGRFEIPAVAWSYFDPARKRYETLRTDPVTLVVDGPALAAAPAAVGPDAPAGLIAAADWRRPLGSGPWLWALLIGGLALPALAAGLVAAARAGRRRLDADTPARRQRRTDAAVRQRLAEARQRDGAAAYAEVERAVHVALDERYGIASGALARDALDRALADRGAPDALRARLASLLAACEQGQYAPGLPGALRAADAAAEAEALVEDLSARPRRSVLA